MTHLNSSMMGGRRVAHGCNLNTKSKEINSSEVKRMVGKVVYRIFRSNTYKQISHTGIKHINLTKKIIQLSYFIFRAVSQIYHQT